MSFCPIETTEAERKKCFNGPVKYSHTFFDISWTSLSDLNDFTYNDNNYNTEYGLNYLKYWIFVKLLKILNIS
jgi:hypothetical protein